MKKDNERLFKDDITKDVLDNEIYNQMARNIAKACDIDLAKTPLVDLITTYIDYNSLKFKNKIIKEENQKYKETIDKAIEYLKKWGIEPDADMYCRINEYKEYRELLAILKEVG